MNNPTLSFRVESRNEILMEIPIARIEQDFQQHRDFYVGPGGSDNAIKGRYPKFQQWLQNNPTTPIIAPRIGFSQGKLFFGDGRHRFAVLRDMGYKSICISVEHSEVNKFKAIGAVIVKSPSTIQEKLENIHLEPSDRGALYQSPKGTIYYLSYDSKEDCISAHVESNPYKPVGWFYFFVNGSTLRPNDDDDTSAIWVMYTCQRQGLGTAMVKYAMQVTYTTEFVRSDIETKQGQAFFPSLKERSNFHTSTRNNMKISPTKLSGMDSYMSVLQRAEQYLREIGTGSSRMVFEFSPGLVLKVAYEDSGIDQNAMEERVTNSGVDIVPQVVYADPRHFFLIAERAEEIYGRKFRELTGSSLSALADFLSCYSTAVLGKTPPEAEYSYNKETAEERMRYYFYMGDVQNNWFTKQCISLVKEFDLVPRDIREENIGSIIRDGKEVPVILDAGFSYQVRQMNWDGIKTPKTKWEATKKTKRILSEDSPGPVVKDPRNNPRFQRWFGASVVKDDKEVPQVVYHGTLHSFDQFEIGKISELNFAGKGFYFSSSLQDVENNYANTKGPDFIYRCMGEVDQMGRTITREDLLQILKNYPQIGTEPEIVAFSQRLLNLIEQSPDISGPKLFSMFTDRKLDKNVSLIPILLDYVIAQKETHQGAIMPCYLRMINPCYLGFGEMSTYFESTDAVMKIVREMLGRPYQMALMRDRLIREGMFSADTLYQRIIHIGSAVGIPAQDIFSSLLRELGFDGIIMDAENFFPQMPSIHGALHYIVWKPGQVKSAVGNKGNYNMADPKLTEETLEEGKNYGLLYHATSLTGFQGILKKRGIVFQSSVIGPGASSPSKHINRARVSPNAEICAVSFSRNPAIDKSPWITYKKASVILEFDGAKMSDHINLKPFLHGGKKIGSQIRHAHYDGRDKENVGSEEVYGENEERVFGQKGKVLNCLPYLKRVIILYAQFINDIPRNYQFADDCLTPAGLVTSSSSVETLLDNDPDRITQAIEQYIASMIGKSVPVIVSFGGHHNRKNDIKSRVLGPQKPQTQLKHAKPIPPREEYIVEGEEEQEDAPEEFEEASTWIKLGLL